MQRIYQSVIKGHFKDSSQMAFVCGPRQVGKTTIAKNLMKEVSYSTYKNWDVPTDRLEIIERSYESLLSKLVLSPTTNSLLVLDEIHKYVDWKNYVKGLYDLHKDDMNIIVTGSARLNIFKQSGDSLMGRYFLYRIHPISGAENTDRAFDLLVSPSIIPNEKINQLLEFGGFPEPYTKGNKRFLNKWHSLRHQQLIYEDIRSLEAIHNLSQLDLLATILMHQSGQLINYSNLATKVRVSVPTIQRWISVLEQVYYCYHISPWSKNVVRSLLKEPKIYLWDWSLIEDIGQRHENFIASHLLKAIHFWKDCGLGEFSLHFIRTKDQEEVDFLVTKNHEPWILVEVKSSHSAPLSKALQKHKETLKCPFAFQVVFDLEPSDKANNWLQKNVIEKGECDKAVIIPASSFVSILV